MVRSKYLGITFDNGWKVTDAEISGRYGKNKHRKNTYQYVLTRLTSDGKCRKSLTVNHNMICRIARNEITVEQAECKKGNFGNFVNKSEYKFIERR